MNIANKISRNKINIKTCEKADEKTIANTNNGANIGSKIINQHLRITSYIFLSFISINCANNSNLFFFKAYFSVFLPLFFMSFLLFWILLPILLL